MREKKEFLANDPKCSPRHIWESTKTAGEWPGDLQSGMAAVLLAFSFISDLMLCLSLQSTALPQQRPAQQEWISLGSSAGDLCRPGADVPRLESPSVYPGSPELPGASSGLSLCVECK